MADTERFHMRITPEDDAILTRLESAYGQDRSGIIRLAIRYLEQHGPMRPKEREMAHNTASAVEFTVRFRSGYEDTAIIERDTALSSEYWVEITQRQNVYNLADEPVAVDGIDLDEDGEWMKYVDSKLVQAFGVTVDQLYH